MSMSVARTESGPQRRRVVSFILRGLSVRRLSHQRFKRKQTSVTTAVTTAPVQDVDQNMAKTGESEIVASNSDAANRSNEQSVSSLVQDSDANQLAAKSNESTPPVDIDKRVLAILPLPDTAGGVGQLTEGLEEEKPAAMPNLQPHLSTTSVNTAGGDRIALPRRIVRRVKTGARSIGNRLKRKDSMAEGSIAVTRTDKLASGVPSSSIRDVDPPSDTNQCSAVVPRADGIQKRSGNTESAELIATESISLPLKDSMSEESIPMASTIQPASGASSSVRDKPPPLEINQRGDGDISPGVPYALVSKEQPKDAKETGQAAAESEEIRKLRQDLSDAYAKIAELEKRCEAQSRDLENSNNFLNAADKSSDSDVIHALQRLNAELQQSTSYMADFLAGIFEFANLATNPTKDQLSAVQRVSECIGRALTKSLGTKTQEYIPMLLQVAFQAYLASALCQTASSWAFEPGNDTFIDGIYKKLRKAEAQAISGRWRSLTRVHTVQTWIAYPESLVRGIITDMADILLAAGCTAGRSDIISKVTTKFEERIVSLVDLARHLNKMFNEVITSDFEVFAVRPGDKFEDKKMEDADDDDDQVGIQEASVLCTTHLGLTKWVPMGTLWERGRKQKVVVLKAKVVLESFLDTDIDD